MSEVNYTTEVKMDEFGEYYIEIPDEILHSMGWNIGDDLDVSTENGTIILRKI